MANLSWKTTTAQMYRGVLIYSLCGVAASILAPIISAAAVASFVNGGGSFSGGSFGLLSIINLLLGLAILAGYILFFLGLKDFRGVVNTADVPAVGKIYTAVILNIVGYFLKLIPVISIVGGILNLVAFILMLIGFAALKNSTTFPGLARTGASKLFVAMILSLVGAVLGWIPVIGILGAICNIVAFVMTILGWKSIADAEA